MYHVHTHTHIHIYTHTHTKCTYERTHARLERQRGSERARSRCRPRKLCTSLLFDEIKPHFAPPMQGLHCTHVLQDQYLSSTKIGRKTAVQQSRSTRARRNPSPRMIKVTVLEKRRVNEEQPPPASSPSRKSRQRGAQTTPAHLHWCGANPPSSWPRSSVLIVLILFVYELILRTLPTKRKAVDMKQNLCQQQVIWLSLQSLLRKSCLNCTRRLWLLYIHCRQSR